VKKAQEEQEESSSPLLTILVSCPSEPTALYRSPPFATELPGFPALNGLLEQADGA